MAHKFVRPSVTMWSQDLNCPCMDFNQLTKYYVLSWKYKELSFSHYLWVEQGAQWQQVSQSFQSNLLKSPPKEIPQVQRSLQDTSCIGTLLDDSKAQIQIVWSQVPPTQLRQNIPNMCSTKIAYHSSQMH
jgi:hypothetical protein